MNCSEQQIRRGCKRQLEHRCMRQYMIQLVTKVTEECCKSFSGDESSEWPNFYLRKMIKLCKDCNEHESCETTSPARELRLLFVDEPKLFVKLLTCIELATWQIRHDIMTQRKKGTIGGFTINGLGKSDPGVRFDDALRNPRSWQVLVAVLATILCSPFAQSDFKIQFLKIDVCPAAGKTYAAAWCACLAYHFNFTNKVKCIAGDKTCIRSQWKTLLSVVLGESTVQIGMFQGMPKLLKDDSDKVLTIVDEAHHAKDDNTWGKQLRKFLNQFTNPTILLTGTDMDECGILKEAHLLLNISYATALCQGWVRKVNVSNLSQRIYVEGALGEKCMEREKLYLSLIPQKPKVSCPEQYDQFKKSAYVQSLAHVICTQYDESMRLQNDRIGKCMVFIKSETQAIKNRLDKAGWNEQHNSCFISQNQQKGKSSTKKTDAYELLSKKALTAAVEVARERKNVAFRRPDFYWAAEETEGLEQFRKAVKSSNTQIIFCFAKEQGGEGFDDPFVNAILFVLSASTTLRTYQVTARAVRPCGKQPEKEEAHVFCLDDSDTRYDEICRLFGNEATHFSRRLNESKIIVNPLTEEDLNEHSIATDHVEQHESITHFPSMRVSTWINLTSISFKEGQCGKLPVCQVRNAIFFDRFERVAGVEELVQLIEFQSGRPAIRMPTEVWRFLQGAFLYKDALIPTDREMKFLQHVSEARTTQRHNLRSFCTNDPSGTLKKLSDNIQECYEILFPGEASTDKKCLIAERIVRETWRHFGIVSNECPGPMFNYKEVCSGCHKCGFEPSLFTCMDLYSSMDGDSDCWCESLHAASERHWDIWQAVYVPSRLQYLKDQSDGIPIVNLDREIEEVKLHIEKQLNE